ncbi:MAG: hypothetical protein AAB548_00060, partial [Patescibacteria group bacterium]
NLYQTYSPYWKSVKVSSDFPGQPLLRQIASLPYYYLKAIRTPGNTPSATKQDWYNTWKVPAGSSSLAIFYLPQYLEFTGFLLLLTPLLTIPVYILFIRKKAPPKK